MDETDEMRRARYDLHMLSATDPTAASNMLRHVAAFSLMLTGRRGRETREGEPQIVAGFLLTHGDHRIPGEAVRRGGVDTVYLAFDVDDASGPPLAAGVFRREGEDVVVYGCCRLWSSANDGRAILVPQGAGDPVGYLAFRPNRPLSLVRAAVPGDLDAGFRRADSRLRRLLGSEELRHVGHEGFLHCIRSKEGRLCADVKRLPA